MKKSLVLASGSPRRAELLRQIGLSFKVVVSGIDETEPKSIHSAQKYVVSLAFKKARHVQKNHPNAIILGADTVVVLEKKIMGKPADKTEAIDMLTKLSGKTHSVITGIALLHKKKTLTDWCKTEVIFRKLSSRFILDYVATGEPMDKAGAYGVQGLGALCVEKINGDYFNVVGLPLVKFNNLLQKIKMGEEFRS